MKVLIVYDSVWGNTKKIAQSIGIAITEEVKVLPASEISPAHLESLDFLIVGSPTQGGRPTRAVQAFLKQVPQTTIKDVKVAAFDTRLSTKWVKIFGFAAEKIAGSLKAKGGTLILPPGGFFIKGKEGPLKEGELERAADWANEIVKNKKRGSINAPLISKS